MINTASSRNYAADLNACQIIWEAKGEIPNKLGDVILRLMGISSKMNEYSLERDPCPWVLGVKTFVSFSEPVYSSLSQSPQVSSLLLCCMSGAVTCEASQASISCVSCWPRPKLLRWLFSRPPKFSRPPDLPSVRGPMRPPLPPRLTNPPPRPVPRTPLFRPPRYSSLSRSPPYERPFPRVSPSRSRNSRAGLEPPLSVDWKQISKKLQID